MKKIIIATILFLTSFYVNAQHEHHRSKEKIPAEVEKLLQKYACLSCHNVDVKLVGPAYRQVAGRKYTPQQIVELIHNPKPANWPGYPPMSPMKHVPAEDALKIAKWIISLHKK